jgi:site-specific DNA-methyltransferase (adenine-specific)
MPSPLSVALRLGDCVEVLAEYETGGFSWIICDPPYGLRFMLKEFDDLGDGAAQREWHKGWVEQAFRVLPSGGVLKAFSGTRTFHHLAFAMEGAGFTDIHLETWLYGTGFPKSQDISKAIDKMLGAKREPKRVPYSGNAVLRSGGQNTRPWMEEALKKGYHELPGDEPASDEAKTWAGYGTALKPSLEPVLVGVRP